MTSYTLHTANRHPTDRCPGFITDLLLRCAARDETALGSLLDHLYPLVSSLVGGPIPSDADKALVLAVFRRLWDQAPAYDPKYREPVEWIVAQARELRGVPDAQLLSVAWID